MQSPQQQLNLEELSNLENNEPSIVFKSGAYLVYF